MNRVRAVLGATGLFVGVFLVSASVWKLSAPDYVAAFLLLFGAVAAFRAGAEILRPVVGE